MAKDLRGRKFGRLLVLCTAGRTPRREIKWLCRCDCGNRKVVKSTNLERGTTKSCGCLFVEMLKQKHESQFRHGLCGTPEHRAWAAMKSRCMDQTHKFYADYGGRGITVCERWQDFRNFIADMGKRPTTKHTLERLDNSLGYVPGNCEWATRKQQANNRRSSRVLEFRGERLTASQWAQRLGHNVNDIYRRLNHGWSVEKALMTPIKRYDVSLSVGEESRRLSEWARISGTPTYLIAQRIKRGWDARKAIFSRAERDGFKGARG